MLTTRFDLSELEKEFKQFQFPQFIKDFLQELADTKLFKKTFEESSKYLDNLEWYKENKWIFFDYRFRKNNQFEMFHNKEKLHDNLTFGVIGKYQGESFKTVVVNFETGDALIEEGYCWGPWCSRASRRQRPIPKYMKPILEKYYIAYREWLKNEK